MEKWIEWLVKFDKDNGMGRGWLRDIGVEVNS